MKKLLLFVVVLVATTAVYGQNPLTEGDKLFEAGKYAEAKAQYTLHKEISKDRLDYADTRIAHCDECIRLLPIADYQFSEGDFAKAKENYDMILAINPKDPTAAGRLSQIPSMPEGAITLFGYLQVFPTDLGEFSTVPTTVIENLNSQGIHGYDSWRTPTAEELALMKTSASQIGLTSGSYMISDGETKPGIVRLVTTDESVAEKLKFAENLRVNQETGVLINGVRWATNNVAGLGTFTANPWDKGGLLYYAEAIRACPTGWRLPTKDELSSLAGANYKWTTVNGIGGGLFSNGDNVVFLPGPGVYYQNITTHHYVDSRGFYWSSTAYGNSSSYSYNLVFDDVNKTAIVNHESHYNGHSVRCVKQ